MMAYSMKRGGKEIGPASVYAEPHTMDGKKLKVSASPDNSKLDTVAMSVGPYTNKPDKAIKTSGIKMRGTGCATKGTMSRGPMA